ncbi:MAG TPA: tyrosine-type recombinase/integrase [Paraburkholderia sp.]
MCSQSRARGRKKSAYPVRSPKAADSLQSYVTGLYRAAGLGAGYSSHTGRRTFASRLMANEHSLETVQILLGHAHLDHLSPYLAVSKRDQREAVAAIDLGE